MEENNVAGIGEERPNYHVAYRSKNIDKVDAEMFLANLPIKVRLNSGSQDSIARLEVNIQGPTIQIFPPQGAEIGGIWFEQDEDGRKVTDKIRVESIACDLVDNMTGRVFNQSTTINVKPYDLGVTSWVGLYDFQRRQTATEEVKVFIYRRPRGKWEEGKC